MTHLVELDLDETSPDTWLSESSQNQTKHEDESLCSHNSICDAGSHLVHCQGPTLKCVKKVDSCWKKGKLSVNAVFQHDLKVLREDSPHKFFTENSGVWNYFSMKIFFTNNFQNLPSARSMSRPRIGPPRTFRILGHEGCEVH